MTEIGDDRSAYKKQPSEREQCECECEAREAAQTLGYALSHGFRSCGFPTGGRTLARAFCFRRPCFESAMTHKVRASVRPPGSLRASLSIPSFGRVHYYEFDSRNYSDQFSSFPLSLSPSPALVADAVRSVDHLPHAVRSLTTAAATAIVSAVTSSPVARIDGGVCCVAEQPPQDGMCMRITPSFLMTASSSHILIFHYSHHRHTPNTHLTLRPNPPAAPDHHAGDCQPDRCFIPLCTARSSKPLLMTPADPPLSQRSQDVFSSPSASLIS